MLVRSEKPTYLSKRSFRKEREIKQKKKIQKVKEIENGILWFCFIYFRSFPPRWLHDKESVFLSVGLVGRLRPPWKGASGRLIAG